MRRRDPRLLLCVAQKKTPVIIVRAFRGHRAEQAVHLHWTACGWLSGDVVNSEAVSMALASADGVLGVVPLAKISAGYVLFLLDLVRSLKTDNAFSATWRLLAVDGLREHNARLGAYESCRPLLLD